MRKIEVVRWRAFTLESSSKAVELRLRDWRKIRAVLRKVEHWRGCNTCVEDEFGLVDAFDALNRETKK
jgi:hypothetical protein